MFFFDMDGVLTDSNGVWKRVDREFLARRGMKYTHAYYEGVAHVPLPLAAVFTKEFCHLSESCEDIIAEWMELAADSYAHVPVKPGVRAYLKQCKNEGRRMAVVTSSVPEHCHTALETLGLEKYFERVTFAHDLGLQKRGPEVWLAAAKAAGVRPEDCTVFDDSLAACQGARAAKMRVVGVYDGLFAQDEKEMRGYCDVYIKSFEELLLSRDPKPAAAKR
nr:HAD family phosphatase [uncultured Oscillibacter sp.]